MNIAITEMLQQRMTELAALNISHRSWNLFEEWHARTRPLILEHFSTHLDQFDKCLRIPRIFSIPEHKNRSAKSMSTPTSESQNDTLAANAKAQCSAFLTSILELSIPAQQDQIGDCMQTTINFNDSKSIFIVHGHDDAMKLSVARTLEKLGLKPIILHEQPNGGRTIIEKFDKNADVGFAVVLLSPDDVGYSKADGAKAKKDRARQNVIAELGYFVGRLGRDRVMALKKGDVVVPSDFNGVGYTVFDTAGAWKLELVKELKAAKYNVDANAL